MVGVSACYVCRAAGPVRGPVRLGGKLLCQRTPTAGSAFFASGERRVMMGPVMRRAKAASAAPRQRGRSSKMGASDAHGLRAAAARRAPRWIHGMKHGEQGVFNSGLDGGRGCDS